MPDSKPGRRVMLVDEKVYQSICSKPGARVEHDTDAEYVTVEGRVYRRPPRAGARSEVEAVAADAAGTNVVGRGWRLSGGDLDDPVITDVIFEGMISRLDLARGFLGVIVVLDRENKDWRTVTFWDCAESRERWTPEMRHTVQAVNALAGTECIGPNYYEVAVSQFRRFLAEAFDSETINEMFMRSSVLEGVGVDDPELVALLVRHTESAIVPAPGCLGALLLVDHDLDRPALIASSFWTDPAAAARTLPSAQVAHAAALVLVPQSSVTTGIYEVLTYQPMR